MKPFEENDLIQSIIYLKKGYNELSKYLDGKNKRGILTTISNNILEIKKYVDYKGYDGDVVTRIWNNEDVIEKESLYYYISRDFYLCSEPSYDISIIGLDDEKLSECILSNNSYEKIISNWTKRLNIDKDKIKDFNGEIFKNTKKPKII